MDGVRHSRGEGVGAGWGRLPRSVQLGVDRDADGDLLFDVFVAVRILCGEEFRGAGLDDAGGANSGGDAHAQGVLHYRKNGEQLRGAGLHGAGVDGGGAGDAMGASRSEADFIMAVVVAVPADCAASNVHNGQRRVAFETVPVLRGGVGNVIYFFLWTFALAAGVQSGFDDPAGVRVLEKSTRQAMERVNPGSAANSGFSLTIGGERASRTFLWNGVDWTLRGVGSRLLWVVVGLGVALLASVFFHRFDPARERIGKKKFEKESGGVVEDAAEDPREREIRIGTHAARVYEPAATGLGHTVLTALDGRAHNRFARLALSEWALMAKGLRWWWYVVAAGLLVAEFVSPTVQAREGVLLAAWIWPVLVWSQMGCRETRYGMHSLIFSAERVVYRQLMALWMAGVAIALVTGAGAGIRLLLSSNGRMFAAWFAGALFIPSMALAMGVWSGSSKLFEAVYTVCWYLGPLHQMPSLDFVGGTRASSSAGLYLALAAGLLLAACLGRRRQVAYA